MDYRLTAAARISSQIALVAWRDGARQTETFQGRWLVEPRADSDGAAELQPGEPRWAVALDDDDWWVVYVHYPAGGSLPYVQRYPDPALALRNGVPQDVVEEALIRLNGAEVDGD